jgi:hypothetical protein
VQIPFPPPGFVPPPPDFLDFVMVYVAALELVLLMLPRKLAIRIIETLFPALRRPL